MAFRRVNFQRIKIHRNYSIDEAAKLLGIHKNSIRAWFKSGLERIDNKRPTLVHGNELKRFARQRRAENKCPCPPGHFYCLRCRKPKLPAGRKVEYEPISATTGNLRGRCPDCSAIMNRRTSLDKLSTATGGLAICPNASSATPKRESGSLPRLSLAKERKINGNA